MNTNYVPSVFTMSIVLEKSEYMMYSVCIQSEYRKKGKNIFPLVIIMRGHMLRWGFECKTQTLSEYVSPDSRSDTMKI